MCSSAKVHRHSLALGNMIRGQSVPCSDSMCFVTRRMSRSSAATGGTGLRCKYTVANLYRRVPYDASVSVDSDLEA